MKKLLLTGAPRSGTSLLHSLIDVHDKIDLFFEEGNWSMITSMVNGFNTLLFLLSPDKYKRKDGQNSFSTYFSLSKNSSKQDSQDKKIKNKTNLTLTGTKMCTPNQIQPMGVRHLSNIDWKIIFIYRDGRDAISSMIGRGNNSIGFASHKWNTAIDLQKNLESKNNVMSVPFETLLFHEEEVLKSISDFLDIEFQEKMMYGFTDIEKEEYNKKSLDKSKAFSYKEKEDKELIERIEDFTNQNLDYCNKARKRFKKSL